jgi:hypothetical protein
MSRSLSLFAAGGLLLGLLAAAPVARAADEGNTSGPAVGKAVTPSTAMMKKGTGKASPGTQAVQGDLGVGAPGVTAKPNTEAGPAGKSATGNMPGTGSESTTR